MPNVILYRILALGCLLFLACGESKPSSGQLIILSDGGLSDTDGTMMSTTDMGPQSACQSAGNGVCDEPSRCALGTDEADCTAACEAGGDGLAFIGAACHYRGLVEVMGRPSRNAEPILTVPDWIDESLSAPTDMGTEAIRYYRLFVPPGLPMDEKVPLVLVLPGNRVSHFSLPNYTELDPTAIANQFIVAYVEQPWRSRYFAWSWYTDWTWNENPAQNPDLIFLRRLVDHLVATRPVDASRVYVSGHSRGAAMSVIAALEMPDVFAAAIPQSGFVEFGYFDRVLAWQGERRPAFFFMHGALDDDVCVDCRPNGRCGVNRARGCGTVAASDALVEALRNQGWDESNLFYARPERVAHRWQPWLNQTWWDFVSTHQVNGGGQ